MLSWQGSHVEAPTALPPQTLGSEGCCPWGGNLWSSGKLSLDATPSACTETNLQAQLVGHRSPEKARELFLHKSPLTLVHSCFRHIRCFMPSVEQLQRNRGINSLKLCGTETYIIHFWSSYYFFFRAMEKSSRRRVFQCAGG